MKRRSLLLLPPAAWALAGAGCASLTGPSEYLLTAQRLQAALDERFPLRHALGGLVQLDLRTPRLQLQPERNRLLAEVLLEASGPALGRSYSGGFDLGFGLRYEPSDQTVRARDLEVQNLRIAGLAGRPAELLQAGLPVLMRQLLGEVVLHRLQPQALSAARARGLQPQSMDVVPEGVRVRFAPATGR